MPLDERAERFVRRRRRVVVEQLGGLAVESLDLGEHSEVARPGQIRQRREQPADAAGTRVLEARAASSRTDIDMSVSLRRDAELGEQPAQRGVGAVVVDQERRVDADDVAVAAVDEVGVRMSAESGVGLEQGDPVAGRQHVGRRQAGNAAADDGDRPPGELFTFHDLYSEPRAMTDGCRSHCVTLSPRNVPIRGDDAVSQRNRVDGRLRTDG